MSIQAVLLPLFVQVALTFVLLFWMARLRVAAVTSGRVKARDIALSPAGWPERETQIGNAFHNQLQAPLLFFLLVTLALITRKADLPFVVLSWLFVLLRLGHAFELVTANNVRRRFYWFASAAVVLLVMWIIFAVQILFGL
jgi:hypothetical protein